MIIKSSIKRYLLKKRGLRLDRHSDVNYDVMVKDAGALSRVIDSALHITSMGRGCFFEHVFSYGDIELGNYVSISGPGTVLHAEKNQIRIGNFVSIGPGTQIVEFNHRTDLPSTYAMQLNFFTKDFGDDVCSKGSIIIDDDVWIADGVTVLSGVHIGQGSVIGAGSIVTKSVPPYSICGGVPCRVIKYRFSDQIIDKLRNIDWEKYRFSPDDLKILATLINYCHILVIKGTAINNNFEGIYLIIKSVINGV